MHYAYRCNPLSRYSFPSVPALCMGPSKNPYEVPLKDWHNKTHNMSFLTSMRIDEMNYKTPAKTWLTLPRRSKK